jgi:carbonic anhydrase
MSCTAPLNIVKKTAGRCSLKCLLWYNYTASTCTIKTNTDYISIHYDGSSDVMYNSVKYKPKELRLYRPSLHTFDGYHADAELLVVHTSSSGGLMIGLPITGNSDKNGSTASVLLSEIIKNAPETGNSVTINLQDFNLNYVIPKSPYFSYIGTAPFDGCTSSTMYNYVVFPKQSIYINRSTLDALANAINESEMPTHEGDAFWNEKGTTNNGFSGDGQIYIDCQPTGQEEEILYKEDSSANKNANMDWVYTVVKYVVGFIICIMAWKLLNGFIKFIKLISNKLSEPDKVKST